LAVDFQVVFPQQVVHLNAVRILPGMVPRTVDLLSADFRSVDEVLINGLVSPDVVILSQTRLLAQVPDALVRDTITSVTVTSSKLTLTSRSLIKFRLGKTPSKVSGILRLVQIFLKILFTTTGTDIFSPRVGGNALKNIGVTFGAGAGGSIVSDFVVAVDTTQRQIQTIQARDPTIPRDERLLLARVTRAGYDRTEAALIVSLELTSQAGQAATANVMI
jgi:hypothetical protein